MNKLYAVILGLFLSTDVMAGVSPLPDGPYVVADGEATLQVPPDTAIIEFSLSRTAKTTALAAQAVDDKTAAALKVVKDLSIPLDDVHASSVEVRADYDYQGEKQTYKGQLVERDVRITLHDLSKFSALMQGLLDVNIDEMHQVDFSSSHDAENKRKAMDAAIDDAHAQADEMATHAGRHLGNAYSMASNEYRSFQTQGFPFAFTMPAEADVLAAPAGRGSRTYVVPKTIEAHYKVTVVYTLTP